MGRNREDVPIGHQKKNQRHEERHENRETGNLRENKRIFILRDRTGTRRQQIRLSLAMMARIAIPPAMEMKGADT